MPIRIIRTFKGEFKKWEVTERCGAKGNTLSKALNDCITEGVVVDLGGNPKRYKAA